MPSPATPSEPSLAGMSLPASRSRLSRPARRIPLPTQTLHSHAFSQLTSPSSEARFPKASSYFAIPPKAAVKPSTSAPTHDAALLPLSLSSSSTSSSAAAARPKSPVLPGPIPPLRFASSSWPRPSSTSAPTPLAVQEQLAQPHAARRLSSRTSSLNYSAVNLPIDFAMSFGTISTSNESFWGIQTLAQGNTERKRTRRRTGQRAHIQSPETTPSPPPPTLEGSS